jgi:phosphinothricin acetyltransferase
MFVIEKMKDEDWPVVRAIYGAGMAAGNATFETEAPEWEAWHSNHLPVGRLVARAGEQVIGWAALSPVSRRPVYAGVAEVSIYVAAPAQGQGVGQALMQALITEAEEAGIWTLQATIFPENEASFRLHEVNGFRRVGRRERIAQRHGVWRDTILMERRSRRVG